MTNTYRGPLAILAALVLCAVTTTTAAVTHELHGGSLAALDIRSAPTAPEEVAPPPEPCDEGDYGAPETIG